MSGSPISSDPRPGPDDDLLGTIARGCTTEPSEGDGVIILQNLLSAGGESTTSLLGNSVRKILADDPTCNSSSATTPD
jgi:hypothetical protein